MARTRSARTRASLRQVGVQRTCSNEALVTQVDPSLPFGGKVEGRGATIGEASVVATPGSFRVVRTNLRGWEVAIGSPIQFFRLRHSLPSPAVELLLLLLRSSERVLRPRPVVRLSPRAVAERYRDRPESLAARQTTPAPPLPTVVVQLRHVRLASVPSNCLMIELASSLARLTASADCSSRHRIAAAASDTISNATVALSLG